MDISYPTSVGTSFFDFPTVPLDASTFNTCDDGTLFGPSMVIHNYEDNYENMSANNIRRILEARRSDQAHSTFSAPASMANRERAQQGLSMHLIPPSVGEPKRRAASYSGAGYIEARAIWPAGISKRGAEPTVHLKAPPKRVRTGSSQGDFDEDDEFASEEDSPQLGKLGAVTSQSSSLSFACPFYRRFPARHYQCTTHKLKRIRDVKQHIQRRHAQTILYCPLCYESFHSPDLRDSHTRSMSCHKRDPPTTDHCDGVSQEAQELLKNRVGRKLSKSEQWYEVWDILFKGEKRPQSPYAGTMVQETIGMLRDFWKQEGPQIVPVFLENKRVQGCQHCDSWDLNQLLTDLFDEVQDRCEQKTHEAGSVSHAASRRPSRTESTPNHDDEPHSLFTSTPRLAPAKDNGWGEPNPYVFQQGTAESSVDGWNLLRSCATSVTDASEQLIIGDVEQCSFPRNDCRLPQDMTENMLSLGLDGELIGVQNRVVAREL